MNSRVAAPSSVVGQKTEFLLASHGHSTHAAGGRTNVTRRAKNSVFQTTVTCNATNSRPTIRNVLKHQYLRQNSEQKRAIVVELMSLTTSTWRLQKPMIEILPFLACLAPVLTGATCQQLSRIALAMIAMSGRVTMLGISRWTGAGGSYRTVQ